MWWVKKPKLKPDPMFLFPGVKGFEDCPWSEYAGRPKGMARSGNPAGCCPVIEPKQSYRKGSNHHFQYSPEQITETLTQFTHLKSQHIHISRVFFSWEHCKSDGQKSIKTFQVASTISSTRLRSHGFFYSWPTVGIRCTFEKSIKGKQNRLLTIKKMFLLLIFRSWSSFSIFSFFFLSFPIPSSIPASP